MSSKKKTKLSNRLISRAEGGIAFLEQCLEKIHTQGTDPAYSRSIYILHSYNFELVLKSRLVLLSKKKTIREIDKDHRGHDLEKLSEHENLNNIGIIKIKQYTTKFKRYKIKTIYGDFTIQDMVDVRYDYFESKLRQTDHYESKRIKKELSIMKNIIEKIKVLISEQ